MIYLGADHRGYNLKEAIKLFLEEKGLNFVDEGATKYNADDDYPDFAGKVARKVSSSPRNKGILICGSGVGMTIAANKVKNIRAGLCLSGYMGQRAKEEDNINILCLAADITDLKTAQTIIQKWLSSKFKKNLKYQRRIKKIKKIEQS